jgi:hypothetical protein
MGRKAMYQRRCHLQPAITSARCPSPILNLVPGGWWRARVAFAAVLIMLFIFTGCVRQAAPAPAVQRSTPPPWSAPRDAISYIEAAGLEPQPMSNKENSRLINLRITVDGGLVEVPAYVGVDRVRGMQAVAHTHDSSGQVWLEGRGADTVTLGQFFTLWGVRLDDQCLGSACGALVVKVDTVPAAKPREVRLATSHLIEITARS